MSSQSMGSPSLKSLISVSIPLMLTGATESIMLFIDRVFLAHHSVGALNAASATFLMTAVFVFFGVAIAGIAEVLAGQYNGEKRFDLVARPIWQMLWFSLSLFIFFIPLGLWGKTWLIPRELWESASGYFTVICVSGPLWSMQVVLAGFFACTGRSKWLIPVAILANIINLVLDYFLIFGTKSIAPMGATGAALATVAAQGLHVLILFGLFLRKKEQEKYGTANISWYPKEVIQAIRVGVPNAISHGVEISAWAFIYRLAGSISIAHLTVLSTVTASFTLLGFLNEGLKQGVIAIASNLIGKNQFDKIKTLLSSGIKLQALIGFLSFFPMILAPHYLISLMGEVGKDISLHHDLKMGLIFMWLFIIFDGLVWVLNGILTAGGDTKVTMLINIGSAWFVAAIPSSLLLIRGETPPWVLLVFSMSYGLINFLLHGFRYHQGKWQNKLTS